MDDYILLVCLICALIIIAIIVLQFALLIQARSLVFKQQEELTQQKSSLMKMSDDMDMILNKINAGIKYKINSSAISILDLAEFKDLDPFLKDQYQRYIVDILAPAIMEGINKTAKDNNLEEYIAKHDPEIMQAAYQIARDIKMNGFNFPPQTPQLPPAPPTLQPPSLENNMTPPNIFS